MPLRSDERRRRRRGGHSTPARSALGPVRHGEVRGGGPRSEGHRTHSRVVRPARDPRGLTSVASIGAAGPGPSGGPNRDNSDRRGRVRQMRRDEISRASTTTSTETGRSFVRVCAGRRVAPHVTRRVGSRFAPDEYRSTGDFLDRFDRSLRSSNRRARSPRRAAWSAIRPPPRAPLASARPRRSSRRTDRENAADFELIEFAARPSRFAWRRPRAVRVRLRRSDVRRPRHRTDGKTSAFTVPRGPARARPAFRDRRVARPSRRHPTTPPRPRRRAPRARVDRRIPSQVKPRLS